MTRDVVGPDDAPTVRVGLFAAVTTLSTKSNEPVNVDDIILRRCDFEGASQVEYSRESGLSIPGAKSRLQWARKRLKARRPPQARLTAGSDDAEANPGSRAHGHACERADVYRVRLAEPGVVVIAREGRGICCVSDRRQTVEVDFERDTEVSCDLRRRFGG